MDSLLNAAWHERAGALELQSPGAVGQAYGAHQNIKSDIQDAAKQNLKNVRA